MRGIEVRLLRMYLVYLVLESCKDFTQLVIEIKLKKNQKPKN